MRRLQPVLMVLAGMVVLAADKVPPALAGQLNIDGKFVETLTLETEQGDLREIEDPGPSWSLPAGRYRVREVHLRGGYHCYCHPAAEKDWFTLTSDEPYQLRVGAPLTPKVSITHWFRFLKLDYELLDADGRNYAGPRTEKPRFAVYSGDRKIGSGSFEHG